MIENIYSLIYYDNNMIPSTHRYRAISVKKPSLTKSIKRSAPKL